PSLSQSSRKYYPRIKQLFVDTYNFAKTRSTSAAWVVLQITHGDFGRPPSNRSVLNLRTKRSSRSSIGSSIRVSENCKLTASRATRWTSIGSCESSTGCDFHVNIDEWFPLLNREYRRWIESHPHAVLAEPVLEEIAQ